MQNNVFDINKSALQKGSEPTDKRRRREFTDDQKRAVVAEAEQTSVSSAARVHNVKPNQIRDWRRRLAEPASSAQRADCHGDLRSELEQGLSMIARQQQIARTISERLARDCETGKAAGYNLSCGLSNATNSLCKLLELRLSIVQRLEQLEVDPEPERLHGFDNPEDSVRKSAERMVYELVKAQVEEERSSTGHRADSN